MRWKKMEDMNIISPEGDQETCQLTKVRLISFSIYPKNHLRIKLNLKKKSSACELFIDTIGPPAGPKTGHR